MRLTLPVSVLLFVLLPATCIASSAIINPPSNLPAPGSVATQFQISDKTDVPGHTLKPGTYAITVVDQLSDRIVVRVSDNNGKELATFLAVVPTSSFPGAAASGAVEMKASKGGRSALRGFKFPDGTVAEFVYPKAEAVSLAKANSTTIPAVDPASEGRVDKPNLSRTDMELVTLWMLTPTTVGPNSQPGMQAERYRPAVASAAPVPPPPTPRAMPTPAPVASTPATAPVLEARATTPPKPVHVAHPIATLPHTASNLPLILLTGLISLFSACVLMLRRLRATDPA